MINFYDRSPSITVIMPNYNCEKYLNDSVMSILNQTHPDFEFIVIDDGSYDNSIALLNNYKDKRIRIFQNKSNRGNYYCRNQGLRCARGKYICVMDSDDIAEPTRLEKQFSYMEDNCEIGISGSFIKNIPGNYSTKFILEHEELKVAFLSNNNCSHPSLIMRKDYLKRFQLTYNENFYYSADYDLCARGFEYFKIKNIPDVLLQYRRHSEQISFSKFASQVKFADMIRINQIINNFEINLEEIPLNIHLKLMKKQPINPCEISVVEDWIFRLSKANKIKSFYNQQILEEYLRSSLVFCISANLRSNDK